MKRDLSINVCVFCFLVFLGVAGRLFQPAWCFTPLAAIALFSGYFFANRSVAVLVPLSAMVISDLWLPGYGHAGVLTVVYAALLLPVVMGATLRPRMSMVRLGAFGVLPAVVFYLTTNFAVWLFEAAYPYTPAGLFACYAAALPFFRMMLVGDVFYVAAVFGCYALVASRAGVGSSIGWRSSPPVSA